MEVKKQFESEECYFCGFNEVIHRHHIIKKGDGGTDEDNNIVILCPNHHFLLHHRKYFLQLIRGVLVLVNCFDIRKKVLPYDWNNKKLRNVPLTSIENAKACGNLIEPEKGKFKLNNNSRFFAVNEVN